MAEVSCLCREPDFEVLHIPMNKAARQTRNLRADCATVLFQILEQGKSARDCLPAMQARHTDQDKAWIQEMVYGVLRQLPLLQFWLRQRLESPLKQKFKIAEHVILIGFYQLAFTRVSQHAAVSETVNACKTLNIVAVGGLVNAVLRNFIRLNTAREMPDDPQIISGLPKWLYKKLSVAYPQELTALISAMESKAPLWLRINTSKISPCDYQNALNEANIPFELCPDLPQAIIIKQGVDVLGLPGFAEGWFAVQDGAAQLAAHYLAALPYDRVLDCCAAPGGKTGHIIEMSQPANIVALEVDAQRAERIAENLTRLDHQAQLIVGDAANPATWWDGQLFDRILLDAPCSATGIIRRHPDIKWLRKSLDIGTLVALQQRILDAIWTLLKPGGVLLYATCSVLPEENGQQIQAFLHRTKDAILDPGFHHDNPLPGQQILPGSQQMDGFYYCRLLKSAENTG